MSYRKYRGIGEEETVPARYEAVTQGQGSRRRPAYQEDSNEDDDTSVDESDRKASREKMERGYKEMMENYADMQSKLANRPNWVPLKTKGAQEPHELTITHVNQTKDLFRADGLGPMNSETQSSEEWLKSHSITHAKLTLKDLVDKGRVQRPIKNQETGKPQQHIQFEASDINEFEYKLNLIIEKYTKRIKWLLQGSRKFFGLLKGERMAVMVDASDANCGFGRLTSFKDSLMHVIDEQLANKEAIYLMSFASDSRALWKNVMDVNGRSVEEAKEWVSDLQPRGGCNLLAALKNVFKVKDIDSVCLILGSVPDQNAEVLCDFVEQLSVGQDLKVQTCAYDCNNQQTNIVLRRLAEESGGRYYCYSSTCEEQIYTGTDINLVLQEIKQAQTVINKIKEMRQGLLGTALVSVQNEISTEVDKLPQSRFLPRPPGHDHPLQLEMPKFHPNTSSEWLAKNGLKAKRQDLYQVLAPNAYSYREEFIPVIRKTVQSQVNGKAMTQFQWHDGSIKNIHVDMTVLFEYQKQLGSTVKLYEKRIDWLSTASRRLMGSVVEKNVMILIDCSLSNVNYLVHIQHSMRLLLEQQMANKDYFNVIAFGTEIKSFRPTLVRPTPENLQKAWKWILDLQCGGSRNFMGALRNAVENEEEQQHNVEVQGLYLFTSGIPDQSYEHCVSYIEEACSGRDLCVHVVLFNVDDYDAQGAIPSRYANITKTAECLRSLAHMSGGRFHWFRETGIIESDDIAAVTLEIEKALNFSKKASMLVETVKRKYDMGQHGGLPELTDGESIPLPQGTTLKALPPPKHTALSQTRMGIQEDVKEETVEKPSGWRPSSAKKLAGTTGKDPMKKTKTKKSKQAFFYTDSYERGANVGNVYSKYQNTKVQRKPVRMTSIPDKEDQLTTKEWLKMYSLSKLKLDLNKMVSGPEWKHISSPVKALQKNTEAKHCYIFPTINVQGTLKHLQLTPPELKEYEAQLDSVLRRYLKRLQWLLSGSRRIFGTVVESRCAILIDTSGSMEPHMEELKKEMASLIWDQIHRYKIKFNLCRFSKTAEKWKDSIMEPSEANCHEAMQWVSSFMAHGNTCTLEALEMMFADPELEAVYLLTDGKPDTSTSLVLREVTQLNTDRNVRVNTISFNCSDVTANSFLQTLASDTGGRYHQIHTDFDAQLFAHRLLTEGFQDHEKPSLPEFDGDDLRRLGDEITMARRYLTQAKSYQTMYDNLKRPPETPHSCIDDGPNTPKVGPGNRPRSAKH